MLTRSCRTRMPIFLIFLAPALSLAQATQLEIVAPISFPGGITDPKGKAAYIQNETSGVSAVDLETGKDFWTLPLPADPLITRDNKLALLIRVKDKPNQIRVQWVDASAQGRTILESDIVQLPDWANTGIVNGRSFSSHALLQGDKLLLKWEARAFYGGGPYLSSEALKTFEKHAEGVSSINAKTGKFEMLPADKMPIPPQVQLPRQLDTNNRWIGPPIVIDETLYAACIDQGRDLNGKLMLLSWNLKTDQLIESRELVTGQSLNASMLPGTHFIVVRPQNATGPEAPWSFFSVLTGTIESTIPYENNISNMMVIGSRVLYVRTLGIKYTNTPPFYVYSPRELKAVDFKTGNLLWKRTIAPVQLPFPEA